MGTVVKIDGVAVNQAQINCWTSSLQLRLQGYSQLSANRYGGTLLGNADPLLNHDVEIWIDDELVFSGIYVSRQTSFSTQGWVTTWSAFDLRYKADLIPFIDSNTMTDIALFNAAADSPLYFPSRSGMDVGEVVEACLTMSTIAGPFHEQGVGGYTVVGDTYSLPALTLGDLANLTLMPPQPLQVSGAKAFTAIGSFVQSVYANVFPLIQPDGIMRFLRKQDFVEQVLELGDCDARVKPPSIDTDLSECYGAVNLIGQPRTEGKWLALSNGGLEEDFTVGGWTPANWEDVKQARVSGTCTITDTLTVVLTHDPSISWGADELDAAHLRGTLSVSVDVIDGMDAVATRQIVANTASSAGTTTVTLDNPLPATDYTQYQLFALNTDDALVYRRYKITVPEIIEKLAREFNPPSTFVYSTGQAAQLVSTPMGMVSTDTSQVSDSGVVLDLDGTVTFTLPTFIKAGYVVPTDVGVWVPVNTGVLSVRKPASGYEGSAHEDCGVERVLTLYQNDWKDIGTMAAQADYAQHVLDSVKDVVNDVTFSVGKKWLPGLKLGTAVQLVGSGIDEALPIHDVSITWNVQNAEMHTTNITCTNRTQAQPKLLSPDRPDRGFTWGTSGEVNNLFSGENNEK